MENSNRESLEVLLRKEHTSTAQSYTPASISKALHQLEVSAVGQARPEDHSGKRYLRKLSRSTISRYRSGSRRFR